MDMNVFNTEDELRQQADTFTGKVVMNGQEGMLVLHLFEVQRRDNRQLATAASLCSRSSDA